MAGDTAVVEKPARKVVMAGLPSFFRMGVTVNPKGSVEEWAKQSGLDWEAKISPVYYDVPGDDGEPVSLEWKKRTVIYRGDNRQPLSLASDKWQGHQPMQILNFFREYVEKLGFEIESIGCLHGGKKIWVLARTPDQSGSALGESDQIQRYLLLATSFDLSLSTILQQTSVRVICENTLMAALSDSKGRITLSHKLEFRDSDLKARIKLDERWSAFNQMVERMAATKMVAPEEFFRDLFFTEKQIADETYAKSIKAKIDQLMQMYEGAPGQNLPTAQGTVWGALNAVTFAIDHISKARTADVKFDTAFFGYGHKLKVAATNRLARMAKVPAEVLVGL